MDYWKYVSCLLILLIIQSCSWFSGEKRELEVLVRRDFSKYLLPIPSVPYIELMGRIPRSEEIELGRMLFNDPVLSRNNDVSCATCHLTNHGFADGNSLSIGPLGAGGPTSENVGKTFGKGVLSDRRSFGDDGSGFITKNKMFRNTISTINVAFRSKRDNSDGLFHDGRFGSLFFQTLLPIHTPMEVCGENPIPVKNNPYEENGIFFKTPVKLNHVNTYDPNEGRELGEFNGALTEVRGVPTFRPNGTISIPGRNECLAIAIAKLRSIPAYNNMFKKLYGEEVQDKFVAVALSSFIFTHVSKNSPYDNFVQGESSLSVKHLKGLISFFTPLGKSYNYNKYEIKGAGCFKCHEAPLFGGAGFVSLGVRGDEFSTLSKAQNIANLKGSFFGRTRLQRGIDPGCHIADLTVSPEGYAPDIGRANATFKNEDCFKIRVPQLRNIIETYPYFHHGTARAQGYESEDLKLRSMKALEQVVRYHLRGPVDPKTYSQNQSVTKVYFDEFHQKDYFIPTFRQNFVSIDLSDPQINQTNQLFPANLSDVEVENLVYFIAEALLDPKSVVLGDLGGDVSHPLNVPSGFSPAITRDFGTQNELPPNSVFDK